MPEEERLKQPGPLEETISYHRPIESGRAHLARMQALRVSLVIVGLSFALGPAVSMIVGSPGWTWQPRQPEYELMIVGFYLVLGVFLMRAASNPLRHRSIIWFTVWSSLVHAGVMAAHALRDPAERAHFAGVSFLLLVAFVLAAFIPKLGGAWRL